jgi:ABC-type glycerol-3-phosphate transport system substrate-binding protein
MRTMTRGPAAALVAAMLAGCSGAARTADRSNAATELGCPQHVTGTAAQPAQVTMWMFAEDGQPRQPLVADSTAPTATCT